MDQGEIPTEHLIQPHMQKISECLPRLEQNQGPLTFQAKHCDTSSQKAKRSMCKQQYLDYTLQGLRQTLSQASKVRDSRSTINGEAIKKAVQKDYTGKFQIK